MATCRGMGDQSIPEVHPTNDMVHHIKGGTKYLQIRYIHFMLEKKGNELLSKDFWGPPKKSFKQSVKST